MRGALISTGACPEAARRGAETASRGHGGLVHEADSGGGAGEHGLLHVAALADEILDLVAVGNAHHVLFDDGAVVEDGGDVVAGGADQFRAALEGG